MLYLKKIDKHKYVITNYVCIDFVKADVGETLLHVKR